MGEADRLTVDEDEVDLGVRYAGRLDHVLDRLVRPELVRRMVMPLTSGGEEVVELGVGADFDVTVH